MPREDLRKYCIKLCKYAVPKENDYTCFKHKVIVDVNSTVYGCNDFVGKEETIGSIRCPACRSDVVEGIGYSRFHCGNCGQVFSAT
jgi:hypothetical protein